MKSLLYLCHRIPYPPNKGDKIRSYNILKFLSQYHQIHLGAFVDDPDDFRYEGAVAEFCASYCLLPLRPNAAKLRSLAGFVKGEALSLSYYSDKRMREWVNSVAAQNELVGTLIFSSTMAQYVSGKRFSGLKRYIDFIDIDSDKWIQYQSHASPLMKIVYGYEARMLHAWEKRIANEFDRSFFVSEREAELFKRMAPAVSEKISYFNNGVDTSYFSPLERYESPYHDTDKVIVFTGAMDYWANVDAVVWFAKQILPFICEKITKTKFYIVGSKPDEKVLALTASPHVVVTGAVDDVRPYLAHAAVAVAPMRIARGVQNKVLEAMAMALPTVTTSQGYEGINATQGLELIVVDEVGDWVEVLVDLLANGGPSDLGQAARLLVEKEYSWQSNLMRLEYALGGPGAGE